MRPSKQQAPGIHAAGQGQKNEPFDVALRRYGLTVKKQACSQRFVAASITKPTAVRKRKQAAVKRHLKKLQREAKKLGATTDPPAGQARYGGCGSASRSYPAAAVPRRHVYFVPRSELQP